MTSRSLVDAEDGLDVVQGFAPIYADKTRQVLGLIVTEERFESQIIRSVESIIMSLRVKPGAKLIGVSYVILLILMALIIVFSATWLGFYVSKGSLRLYKAWLRLQEK